jgi:hypothetical protein
VVDACAAVNLAPDDGADALARMQAAGAELTTAVER